MYSGAPRHHALCLAAAGVERERVAATHLACGEHRVATYHPHECFAVTPREEVAVASEVAHQLGVSPCREVRNRRHVAGLDEGALSGGRPLRGLQKAPLPSC